MSGSPRYKRTWLLRELVSASVELPISLCTARTYGTCSDYPSEWLEIWVFFGKSGMGVRSKEFVVLR